MSEYIASVPDWWVTTPSGKTFPVGAWQVCDGYLRPMVPGEIEGVPILQPVHEDLLEKHSGDTTAVVERRRR